MLISVIQGSKLFSAVIGDMGILGREIKIEARHQILHHAHAEISACLECTH
jgi:hypothetical protein